MPREKPIDTSTKVAALLFGVPEELVTGQQRQHAKRILYAARYSAAPVNHLEYTRE